MKNVEKMKKLSMIHYRMTFAAVLLTLIGVGIMAFRTLAGIIVGMLFIVAGIVLFVVRNSVKKKFKDEFEQKLTGVVNYSLKKDNVLKNGFKVKKGRGLKYIVKVYDCLSTYAEQELTRRVQLLVQNADMNVKVNIHKSDLDEFINEIFSN